MADVQIFHNPACSKSRGAVEILREDGIDAEVIEYLRHPLDRQTIERILRLLGGDAGELVRKDKRFAELSLNAADYTTAEAVADLLMAHPELMQRPVIVRGEHAVIARPSELVRTLF